MGLFDRFSSKNTETSITGERYQDSLLHIADSISNDGNPNLLLWRTNYSDFNTGSVLTVNPGEAAVFIKNGQVQQEFGPGRYELQSDNYPFLSALRNTLTGGVTTFHCEIYFVRTAVSLEVQWGTSAPIQLRDPVQRLQTSITGNGGYKITIKNPALFISKLAGHAKSFSGDELTKFFSSEFQQTLKSSIATTIRDSGREILDLISDLDTLAQGITPHIAAVLEGYGVGLKNFAINSLFIPEDDPNRQKLEHAFAAQREFETLGANYRMIKGFEIMKDMANNPASGAAEMANMGAGVSMGMAAGSAMAEVARGLYENGGSTAKAQAQTAPATSSNAEDPIQKLSKLKQLLDLGLIEETEYYAAKKEVLAKLVG